MVVLSYEIIFDEAAFSVLNKLPKPVRERIFQRILMAKSNPFYFFERLKGRSDFKLRIGNYRIIADIITVKKESK